MSVKVFVEIADAFVKIVQVINEHPISNHSLLSDTTLQFIPLPASKPYGALDQFFGVFFKVSQDPDIVIHPEHGPLLVPTINHFARRESDPYMEQSRNTQREASTGQGQPAPQAPACHPRKAPCHCPRLSATTALCRSTGGRARCGLRGDKNRPHWVHIGITWTQPSWALPR